MRILVVDDDATGRLLTASVLTRHGHEVIEAVDGEDALKKARGETLDAVLSDILMPNMDGYALCRAWKADPELSKVPLIFYTATYTEREDEVFAGSIGADAFVTKPQEPEHLVELIAAVVKEQAEGTSEPREWDRDELDILRDYSDRLVAKLEHKVLEADKANQELLRALEALSDEVGVKKNLIEKLTADMAENEAKTEQLRSALEVLEAVVMASPVPVIHVGLDRRVRTWNPAAARVFQVSAEEIATMPLGLTKDEESVVSALFEGGLTETTAVRRSHLPDGTEIEYTAMITPTHDTAGDISGFVAVVREWRILGENA